MRYLAFVFAPVAAGLGFILWVTVLAPLTLGHQPRPAPSEPIAFDHSVHVQQAGLSCDFCHRTANISHTAGMPDTQLCMDCHSAVGPGQANQGEIAKVRDAWMQQQAINWQRVYRLPDHVQFDHQAHVAAGVSCATCHGDVSHMNQVTMARPLDMNDCVQCHKQANAPTECAECHY